MCDGHPALSRPLRIPAGGKWLIFVPGRRLKRLWEKVRGATEAGLLGCRAKFSPDKPSVHGRIPGERVICIFTQNCDDIADVFRVRVELRQLGVRDEIPYKTNEDTRLGHYEAYGWTNLDLWRSDGLTITRRVGEAVPPEGR